MTTLIYRIIALLLVVASDANLIVHSKGFLSSSVRSLESVASIPPRNFFYSSQFNKFRKILISPELKAITFYSFVGSGMNKTFYDCEYSYKSTSDGWKMTLADGYKSIIADSKGFYDEKIINGIKGDDISLSIPNADFRYETFRVK